MNEPQDRAQEEVRRLLSDARVIEPVPDDVAARLDRTLADLAAERAWADRVAARRRRTVRQRIAGGVVAAALVVAAGVGLSRLPRTTGGGSAASTSDSARGSSGLDGDAPNQAELLPAIRPGHVVADLRERAASAPARTEGHVCVAGAAGQVARPATYAGRLAALVYDPPRDGQRRVTLYRCDGVHGGQPVGTVLVPAP